MFRLWAKIFKENRLVKDLVVENDDYTLNRTRKVFQAVEEVCISFDLANPIWLEQNITEFQRLSKTRFRQDSFIEHVDFDYMEIQVIEEDY